MGKLNFFIATRSDISFSVGVVNQFLNSPHIDHWNAVVRILRFIKGSPWEDYCMRTGDIKILFLILMQTGLDLLVTGGTPQHIVFSLGGNLISWKSKEQNMQEEVLKLNTEL